MKKIVSLIVVFLLLMTLILTGSSYAASLDTIKINVDKTTVRPGEEVKLTINFGTQLGAYTFNIAYDNNIFDYVSVDAGTANDTTDKVIVVFHDSTGGANPRENMTITFKAKSDITTSNPTEFTVTGEGLANADATVTYDDITTPLVENVTVEPEYKDYVINLEYTGNIKKDEEKDMKLSYSSTMGHYYEHARLVAEATTPTGASVKLTGIDETTGVTQDIIESGWGDPQGYKIGGKDVEQVLNLKALFTEDGEYTVTFKLIDRDNSDAIISQRQFSFKVGEEQQVPPTEESTEKPVEKPTELPKTGNDIYIPMGILMAGLIGFGLYYNKEENK